MGSTLDMINLALTDLGQDTQLTDASLTADPAPKFLRMANRFLPTLLDEYLRRHPWLCAESDMTLTASAEPANPSWRFAQAFLLPVDCLRVWNVDTECEWKRGAVEVLNDDGTLKERRDAILTDHSSTLGVTFARRIPIEALDPCLFRAMACELASRMSGPIEADKQLRRDLANMARELLAIAVTCETSEFGNEAPAFGRSRFLEAR